MEPTLYENLKQAIARFSDDEEGANTLEIVMILAIAAMVAIAIYAFGGSITKWAWGILGKILGWDSDSLTPSGAGQ